MSTTVYEQMEQGSDEWLQARCGILTASVIGQLITPTLKVANNDTSRGVALTLAAERITGHVEYVHPTFDMQRGTEQEPYAREAYAEHYAPVDEVGFIVRKQDGWQLGYSPDGLVGEEGLIEIKSRKPKKHVQTILSGKPPAENMAQLQTGLFVSGRAWIDYVSFSPGMPLWVSRVQPDERWFEVIESTVTEFENTVDATISAFTDAVAGFPATERIPEFDEIRI